ncbi:MAG: exonuclease SbcCD subunit D [Anaerolineae bacterium]|jgi:exonuclease SbcD|nr:exonuclease SbcCD subunit D [Anaerolineae bacterium]MDX9829972.1 exonuclease SbcCD subunit D [Anaerolineae bacterium]
MSGIRILHTADLHIGMENYGRLDPETGLNGRVMDFLRRLSEVVDYALENEIDLVLFAGDAYKNRDPNSTYRREFARRIKRLADHGVPVVLLVGNHDLPSQDRRASSVEIFRTLEVPNILVAHRDHLHRIQTRRGETLQVATVPYPVRNRLLARDEYKERTIAELDNLVQELVAENIRALAAQVDPSLPAVLVGHFSVSEAKFGSERTVMLGRDVVVLKSVLADPAWDYVALGHIHRHQELNRGERPPIVYPGSLERIDFGEEKEAKGFVVATVRRGETEWQFHPVAARRFVTIRVDVRAEADPLAAVLAAIGSHDVDDAIVRVQVQALPEQAGMLRDVEMRRSLAGAYFVAGINVEIERTYRHRLGGESPEGLSPAELLARYLESKGTPAPRIALLMQYADEILKNVEH